MTARLSKQALKQEHWIIHLVIRGAKEHLASWSEPKVVTDCGHGFGSTHLAAVEADWIDDPAAGFYFPAFVKWEDVSAITWYHVLPPPDPAVTTSGPKPAVMRALALGRPMTVAELAASTELSQLALSKALHELAAEGNVRRAPTRSRAEQWQTAMTL